MRSGVEMLEFLEFELTNEKNAIAGGTLPSEIFQPWLKIPSSDDDVEKIRNDFQDIGKYTNDRVDPLTGLP